jgi:hypothetical protein
MRVPARAVACYLQVQTNRCAKRVTTVFSDEELGEIRETVAWLKAAEKSFEFWNNPADAVYDTL